MSCQVNGLGFMQKFCFEQYNIPINVCMSCDSIPHIGYTSAIYFIILSPSVQLVPSVSTLRPLHQRLYAKAVIPMTIISAVWPLIAYLVHTAH